MNSIDSLLQKTVKMSCVDESRLLKRKASLNDSHELLKTIQKDVVSISSQTDIVNAIGVTIILISMVSDIIIDTAGVEVAAANPLFALTIEKVYNKARDNKWSGNKYEKVIRSIEKNTGYLEEVIDKYGRETPTGKALKMVVTTHKHMTANMIGLVGYIEDSRDAKKALGESLKMVSQNIEIIEKSLANTDFYLSTGEGMSIPIMRSTSTAPALRLP